MNKYPSKIEEYFLPGELERLQANFKRYQKSRFWKKIGHLKSFKNRKQLEKIINQNSSNGSSEI